MELILFQIGFGSDFFPTIPIRNNADGGITCNDVGAQYYGNPDVLPGGSVPEYVPKKY